MQIPNFILSILKIYGINILVRKLVDWTLGHSTRVPAHEQFNPLPDKSKYSYPTYALETLPEEQHKRQSIFISYSHSDKEYLDRLLVHLRPLQKQGKMKVWADTHLRAGDKWRHEIQKALESATAAVLIISADFLASDFIVDNELPPILKSAEEKGTRIIPLIVKPCRFTRDPTLNQFQSINDPKDALALLNKGHQERILDELCAQLEQG